MQRQLTLDEEVSLWSKRGYHVLSRTRTTAQLCKPNGSPLLIGILALGVILLFLQFLPVLSQMTAAVAFVIGTVLLSAWHAVRGEKLVYLTVAENGEITQD